MTSTLVSWSHHRDLKRSYGDEIQFWCKLFRLECFPEEDPKAHAQVNRPCRTSPTSPQLGPMTVADQSHKPKTIVPLVAITTWGVDPYIVPKWSNMTLCHPKHITVLENIPYPFKNHILSTILALWVHMVFMTILGRVYPYFEAKWSNRRLYHPEHITVRENISPHNE